LLACALVPACAASSDITTTTETLSGSVSSRWLSLGPAPQPGGYSGRPQAMAFSPDIDGAGTPALLLATAGGGVWRSTSFASAAPVWQPMSSSLAFAPVASQAALNDLGAIAVDPFRGRVIYAASGDVVGGGDSGAYGHGLVKSIDGGQTWTYLGSPSGTGMAPGTNRIFVDPTGPRESCSVGPCAGSRLFLNGDYGPPHSPATYTTHGLFTSTDSGHTWRSIWSNLPVNSDVTDLDYEVQNGALILYAGVLDTTGTHSGINGIWKSTDLGASWQEMSFTFITDYAGNTRKRSEFAAIKLATDHTPNGRNAAVALIVSPVGTDGSVVLNAFTHYNRWWIPCGTGLDNGIGGALNTSSAISVGLDPDDGSIYVGGSTGPGNPHATYQSRDGGNTWFAIDTGTNGVTLHTDQHAWTFRNGVVYNGNDGGVYRFTPLANGRSGPGTWEDLNTPSLSTLLSTYVSPHPVYPNVLLASSHDQDATIRTNRTWSEINLGEDFRVRFDPFDGNFAYGTNLSNGNWFYMSSDGGHTYTDVSPSADKVPNDAVFDFHKTTPGRLAAATNAVWETRSHGAAGSWRNIGRPSSVDVNWTVSALAYGGGEIIHVAYSDRLFRTSSDGSDGWPELNPGHKWGGGITGIAVDRENTARVYLSTDGGHIWRSEDAGVTWSDITGDYPSALPINTLTLRSDSAALEPQVLLASANGAWVGQLAGGTWHWQRLGTGLPDGNISDIQINPTAKTAYVASRGRGVFGTYLSFISDAAPGSLAANNTTFVFAKDLDGRVAANQAAYGSSYSGWNALQGNGIVADAIGASFLSSANVLFAFARGLDNSVQLNQAGFGAAWTGWFRVPGITTDAAPVSASSPAKNQVYVFVKGTDQRIYQNHATYGQAFVGWSEVPGGGLTASPIAAATLPAYDVTFLACRGLDNAVWTNQGPTGSFGGWHRDGTMTTDVAPALAADNTTIYWFVKAMNGHIMMNKAVYGSGGSGWSEVPGGLVSSSAPSAAVLANGVVFLYARDLSGRLMVNQGVNGNFGSWFEVGGGLF